MIQPVSLDQLARLYQARNEANGRMSAALRGKDATLIRLANIERLEAELEALRESNRRLHEVYSSILSESVDYKIRVRQAIKILQGTEE